MGFFSVFGDGFKRSILCAARIGSSLVSTPSVSIVPVRNVIYYTHSQGKFRTNKAVTRRFFRLNWGAWIRPRAGRHKHLWRKPQYLRWWAKQHVFCTEEQNKMLDQMVSARYKHPNYFVDDPYEPYQKRDNFAFVPLGKTRVSKSYIHIFNQN